MYMFVYLCMCVAVPFELCASSRFECWSVLQCVTVRCSSLQCVVVCCSAIRTVCPITSRVLQCFAVCCSAIQTVCPIIFWVLQCVAVCRIVLQCVAVCCSVLQCYSHCVPHHVLDVAVSCSVLQCGAAPLRLCTSSCLELKTSHKGARKGAKTKNSHVSTYRYASKHFLCIPNKSAVNPK